MKLIQIIHQVTIGGKKVGRPKPQKKKLKIKNSNENKSLKETNLGNYTTMKIKTKIIQ